MKNALTFIFALFIFSNTLGQQLPLFTEYREYSTFLNPASVTPDFLDTHIDNFFIGASYRKQNFFNQSPNNIFARMEYIFGHPDKGFRMSGGLSLLKHDINPIQYNGYYGKISSKWKWKGKNKEDGGISLGLNFGLLDYRVKVDELQPHHVEDILLTNNNVNKKVFDVGFGIFVYNRIKNSIIDKKSRKSNNDGDLFYVGISVPQLFGKPATIDFSDNGGSFRIARSAHFYLTGGYQAKFKDGYWEASTWMRYTNNTPLNIDLNLRYVYKEIFWLGGGFKIPINQTKVLHYEFGGFVFNRRKARMRIGFGGDYFIRPTGLNKWAVEVNTSYSFNLKKKK